MIFIIILIAALGLQLFLPWWVVIVIAFATCGLLGKTAKISFWQPFFAILVLWSAVALYKSFPNENLLATRVAEMFSVKYWYAILLITAILGGLAAGISGLCGYHFRKSIRDKKANG